ncbi:histidine phosphatase family protein [Aeromonas sp. sif2416]|uniref:SixA phosphatase family protein n=1 Tax=Aeromonas sp. sif2416 TaxID=2854793 RepID=UPI001C48FF52|nr:histidine phosphatase family protein [Aeromonas sp. sif2416]MBV7437525.1 histidine phosphatase family protein [Aeromonas sp. sif2416]
MERTLLLVRHAKSSWEEVALSDRARPLARRGQRDAPLMGKRLAKAGVKPDAILSSPACRALSTANIIAEALDFRAKSILVDERLYASDVETLLAVIGELGDPLRCVMLFGHNPEFTDLAHRFSGKITRMPTCAVVQFTFDAASWSAIAGLKPVRVLFDYPKQG